MLSSIGSLLLSALAKFVLDYINDRRADAVLKQAGAAETANSVTRESRDADRRASEVVVNAQRGDIVDDDLVAGNRQF